jgi:hypothetical protein
MDWTKLMSAHTDPIDRTKTEARALDMLTALQHGISTHAMSIERAMMLLVSLQFLLEELGFKRINHPHPH